MREYPQAIETEKALLSALMLDGGAIIPAVAELISAEESERSDGNNPLAFLQGTNPFR